MPDESRTPPQLETPRWKLARDSWGQGYATEAGRAAIDWTWSNLDAPELISIIHRESIRSINAAEQLAMSRLRETTFKGKEVLIFGIGKP